MNELRVNPYISITNPLIFSALAKILLSLSCVFVSGIARIST